MYFLLSGEGSTDLGVNNARALSVIAKRHEIERDDEVVAVLFRDADTATAGRGVFEQKRQSMLDGFQEEGFLRGVPMIPKPTSEAWILCALKDVPYRDCGPLEQRSPSKKSANPLKEELAMILGAVSVQTVLCEMIATRSIDIDRIEMNSFSQFRTRLKEVI